MADWRPSLSFFDRFTCVSDMQVQLVKRERWYVSNDCLSSQQALRLAEPKDDNDTDKLGQSLEDQIYQSATSKEGYDDAVKAKIEALKAAKPSQSAAEASILDPLPAIEAKLSPSSDEEKTSFGPYKDAIYHTNGTSSTIYLAHSPTAHSALLALKVTTPQTQPAPHNSLLEIKILQSLPQHLNIIPLLTTQAHHESLILVFPYLPYSLSTILAAPTVLPKSRQKQIIQDMLDGLAFLHANGVVHRDIKPGNILLPSPISGPARIIDFGTAYSPIGNEDPQVKCLDVGTTSYRPPELLFGCQDYGTSLDMWAAGCVIAEVLVPAEKRGRRKGEEAGLFEAGDLGSELQLIKSLFETLGTPTSETWPSSKHCPDWGKMTFKHYPGKSTEETYPGATKEEIDFLSRLVAIESTARMTAAEALQHRFLNE